MNTSDLVLLTLLGLFIVGVVFWLIFSGETIHNCERCRLCRKLHERDDHELFENWEVPGA